MPRRCSRFVALLFVVTALLFGGAVVQPARAAEPIKIGFGMAQTGGLAGGGKQAILAMEIWRDKINAEGGCSAARLS
jgi:branched-chain amino acid transport system substrate-binding protein